jgi:hypothetical protein
MLVGILSRQAIPQAHKFLNQELDPQQLAVSSKVYHSSTNST